MLIFVVLIFFLCWGPRLVLNILQKLTLDKYDYTSYSLRIIFYLLSLTHSALNPFIYGFMSSNFRKMMCSCSSKYNTSSCTLHNTTSTFTNNHAIIGCIRSSVDDSASGMVRKSFNNNHLSPSPSPKHQSSEGIEFSCSVNLHEDSFLENGVNNVDTKNL